MDEDKTDTKWETRGLALLAWVAAHPATAIVVAAAIDVATLLVGILLGAAFG